MDSTIRPADEPRPAAASAGGLGARAGVARLAAPSPGSRTEEGGDEGDQGGGVGGGGVSGGLRRGGRARAGGGGAGAGAAGARRGRDHGDDAEPLRRRRPGGAV